MFEASARPRVRLWGYGLVAAVVVAVLLALLVARLEGGPPPPSGPDLPAELSGSGHGSFVVEITKFTPVVFDIESDGGLLDVRFNRADLGAAGVRLNVLQHFGRYEGTRIVGVAPGMWEVVVDGEDDWRVAVSLPETGGLPLEASAESDWASPLLELSNLTEVEIEYEGDDEFLLFIYRNDGVRLFAPVDTVGSFEQPLRFRTAPGRYMLVVETLGRWSMDVLRTYSDFHHANEEPPADDRHPSCPD
jgi:hypothetical protein